MTVVALFMTTTFLTSAGILVGSHITSLTATPSTFASAQGEKTLITLNVKETAKFSIYVENSNSVKVEPLLKNIRLNPGVYTYTWDGLNVVGTPFADGNYTVRVSATHFLLNDPTVIDEATVNVEIKNNPPLLVSSLVATPDYFISSQGYSLIKFNVNQNSYIDLDIENGNGQDVRTFSSYNGSQLISASDNSILWNGKDDSNNYVAPGTYNAHLTVRDSLGELVEKITKIDVLANNTPALSITSLTVTPVSFEAGAETSVIRFSTNQTANVYLEVRNGSTVLKTFSAYDGDLKNAGNYTQAWDGKNDSGVELNQGAYTVYLRVSNTTGTDTDTETVYVTNATVGAPNIDNLTVTPASFEAGVENTLISFTTDQTANVYVEIRNGSTVLKTFSAYDGDLKNAGNYPLYWNGTNNSGAELTQGGYTVYVRIQNANGVDTATKTIYVENPTTPPTVAPNIKNLNAIPVHFEAGIESTNIYFDIDQNASLDVEIRQGSTVVKQFSAYNGSTTYNSGSYQIVWNGTNNLGNEVPEGTYTVYVTAQNANGSDTAHTSFYVTNGTVQTTGPNVENLRVSPSSFEPVEDSTLISFDTDKLAQLTVEVLSGNTVVKTYSNFNGDNLAAGSHSVSWNGTNNAGNAVSNGLYTVRVTAINADGSDTDSVSVNVSTTPGYPIITITDLTATPSPFEIGSDNVAVKFYLNQDADNINVQVKNGSTLVRQIANNSANQGWITLNWNGRDTNGNYVNDGTYTISVLAENETGSDTETVTVRAESNIITNDGVIENFEINPSSTWDPSDENLEIEFDLTVDVDFLEIYAKNANGKTVDILSDRYASEDSYFEEWDGYDNNDNLISEGVWTIYVEADGDKVYDTVTVDYKDPEFDEIFLTKDSFDPTIDETTSIVFMLTEDSVVTVKVYDGNDKLETLMKDEELERNVWYTVEWDGTDGGREVDEGSYTFELTAEHPYDNNVSVIATKYVSVDDENSVSGRANITEDSTNPIIFDETKSNSVTFSYCIDDAADVTIGIYNNLSASGSADVELIKNYSQTQGCHTVDWNGLDENDRTMSEGVYSYKVTSETSNNRTSTEKGRFVIGDISGNKNTPKPKESECSAYYYDVNGVDVEMCEAITWATNEGIFGGYNDGSFKPYNVINRAETLKVVIEAFKDNLVMLPSNGSNQGFLDLDPNGWYMTYVRTAKFYGMLHGYVDSTEARLGNTINRVEFLKFALEAADAFTEYEIPGYEVTYYSDVEKLFPDNVWYFDYAGAAYTYGLYNTYYDAASHETYLRPGQDVQRGEVALVLYRMYLSGLLNK